MIALFRGVSCVSWAVRWQTRSIYSHAALVTNHGTLIEAVEFVGVRERAIRKTDKYDLFSVEGLTPEKLNIATDVTRSLIGKPYDYLSVLRFLSRRKPSHNNRWFCSELVFAAMESVGIKLLDRITAAEVSPKLLSISPLLCPVS